MTKPNIFKTFVVTVFLLVMPTAYGQTNDEPHRYAPVFKDTVDSEKTKKIFLHTEGRDRGLYTIVPISLIVLITFCVFVISQRAKKIDAPEGGNNDSHDNSTPVHVHKPERSAAPKAGQPGETSSGQLEPTTISPRQPITPTGSPRSSGWATLYRVCGGIILVIGFIGTIAVARKNEEAGFQLAVMAIALTLTCFLFAFLIDVLTDMRHYLKRIAEKQ